MKERGSEPEVSQSKQRRPKPSTKLSMMKSAPRRSPRLSAITDAFIVDHPSGDVSVKMEPSIEQSSIAVQSPGSPSTPKCRSNLTELKSSPRRSPRLRSLLSPVPGVECLSSSPTGVLPVGLVESESNSLQTHTEKQPNSGDIRATKQSVEDNSPRATSQNTKESKLVSESPQTGCATTGFSPRIKSRAHDRRCIIGHVQPRRSPRLAAQLKPGDQSTELISLEYSINGDIKEEIEDPLEGLASGNSLPEEQPDICDSSQSSQENMQQSADHSGISADTLSGMTIQKSSSEKTSTFQESASGKEADYESQHKGSQKSSPTFRRMISSRLDPHIPRPDHTVELSSVVARLRSPRRRSPRYAQTAEMCVSPEIPAAHKRASTRGQNSAGCSPRASSRQKSTSAVRDTASPRHKRNTPNSPLLTRNMQHTVVTEKSTDSYAVDSLADDHLEVPPVESVDESPFSTQFDQDQQDAGMTVPEHGHAGKACSTSESGEMPVESKQMENMHAQEAVLDNFLLLPGKPAAGDPEHVVSVVKISKDMVTEVVNKSNDFAENIAVSSRDKPASEKETAREEITKEMSIGEEHDMTYSQSLNGAVAKNIPKEDHSEQNSAVVLSSSIPEDGTTKPGNTEELTTSAYHKQHISTHHLLTNGPSNVVHRVDEGLVQCVQPDSQSSDTNNIHETITRKQKKQRPRRKKKKVPTATLR